MYRGLTRARRAPLPRRGHAECGRAGRQLNVVRNVIPIVTRRCDTIVELSEMTRAFLREHKLAFEGHPVVLTASHPITGDVTTTNFLKVLSV